MEWIKAMRLKSSLFAGAIALIGFKLNIGSLDESAFILALFTVTGAAATMIKNNWDDRVHDIKRGRTFAHDNAEDYKMFTASIWALTIIFLVYVWSIGISYGIIATILAVFGFFYFATIKVPFLSMLIVAISFGLPSLFSYVEASVDPNALVFFVAILLLSLGREVMTDIRDREDDKGYKETLPCLIGKYASQKVSAIFIGLSAIIMLFVSEIAYFAFVPIACVVFLLFFYGEYAKAKRILDVTTALFLLTMIFL